MKKNVLKKDRIPSIALFGCLVACLGSCFFVPSALRAEETKAERMEKPVSDLAENRAKQSSEQSAPTSTDQASAEQAADPGLSFLEQALDEKLKATDLGDIGRVIALAQRARKEGLSGANLKFCDELIASEQLQRGLMLAQNLLAIPADRLGQDWPVVRTRILNDLEAAVKTLKDQPLAYLRIAQLNLLPGGDAKRSAEALKRVEELGKNDPAILSDVLMVKATLEKDPARQEEIIAEASKVNPNPMLLLRLANNQVGRGQPEKALKTLEKVLELEPTNPQALLALYEIYVKLGKHEEAFNVLDLLDKELPDAKWKFERARLLAAMGRNDEAIGLLDKLREENQGDPAILALRAMIYIETKEFEKALRDVEAALRLDPNRLPFRILKAQIMISQEKFDEAASLLEELVEEHPDHEELTVPLTQVYIAQKKFDKAETLVKKLRDKHPDQDAPVLLLAKVWMDQKKFDKAIALFKEIQAKSPDDEKWTLLLAELFVGQKEVPRAVEILEEFLEKHPGADRVKLMLVMLLADRKQSREALKYLEPLVEKDPDSLTLLRLKGTLLLTANRHSDAVRVLEAVIKREPDDEVSLNNLSWLLSTSPVDMVRNGDRALELARKACELTDYKKAYILSTLAAAYAETGDFDKAVEWSRKSIEMSGEDDNVKERIDELKKELESYEKRRPYREAIEE